MARFAFSLVVLAMALVVSAAPLAQVKRALPTPVAVSTAKTYLSQCAAYIFFPSCDCAEHDRASGVYSDCGGGFELSGVCTRFVQDLGYQYVSFPLFHRVDDSY